MYLPSLLDRLTEGSSPAAQASDPRYSMDQMKETVGRDIEAILNSRPAWCPEELARFPHAAKSVITLGLPDISSLSLGSDADRRTIVEGIRSALLRGDSRLSSVQVSVRETTSATPVDRLVFSIRANVRLNPGTEAVNFDAVMRPGSSLYEVRKPEQGRERLA